MASSLGLDVTAAYLGRLGLDAEPPSIEALQRLHRRHVERVPYETLWIHAGEEWGIDPIESARRIALHGRGGYCYHLNGAFAALLQSLGYEVHRHVGGVHGPDGPDQDSAGNHLVLTVSGLPADDNPAGSWYVDAGLGDALHEALPLVAGVYQQLPFRVVLSESGDDRASWHLAHDPSGGFVGMEWTPGEAEWDTFVPKHAWLSTSPDSGFVRVGMAERRDASGVDVMRGLIVTRVGSDARTGQPLTERGEWFAALGDLFDLRFDSATPQVLDRLWARTLETHRSWEAAEQL
jgi:arylamine N-acetyltransferase